MTDTLETIKIATIIPIGPFSQGFTYAVNDLDVQEGDLVVMSFRKRMEHGICWNVETITIQELESERQLKLMRLLPVQEIEHSALLSAHTRSFLEKVSRYNMIVLGNLLRLVLPDILFKLKKNTDTKILQLTEQANDIVETLPSRSKMAMLQLLHDYKAVNALPDNALKRKVPSSRIKRALQLNILRYVNGPNIAPPAPTNWLTNTQLNLEQREAADQILQHLNKFSVILLHGITGSGKTAVYCEALKHVLSEPNAQVLIMMPEIALTASLIEQLKSKFGTCATLWHSSISNRDKMANIRSIIEGQSIIVVGARSALYLPYKHLKCIVVDEEHDASYKQNEAPVYNARDMAILRGQIGHFPVILSSATPALESYRHAKMGKYMYITMGTRFGDAALPNINIVDLNSDKLPKKKFLSPTTCQKIIKALDSDEQVMIFLNRRGYARIMMCKSCGYMFLCPNCDNRLTYHKFNSNLKCHYCNFNIKLPQKCPQCEDVDSLEDRGLGIEKIAEEVADLVGSAEQVLIMSSDTINSQNTVSHHLERINNRSVKIIVGTQIVSKGHNFPHLKLVVVVDMDIGMISGDFRAMERIYQLLIQVTGRAGRNSASSEVLIQTYNPQHKVLQAIVNGKHREFYEHELQSRQEATLPPFSKQIAIIVSSENDVTARQNAQAVSRNIGAFLATNPQYRNCVRILGPVESIIHYLKRKYRYRILLCSNTMSPIHQIIERCVANIKMSTGAQIKIDVDPYNFT